MTTPEGALKLRCELHNIGGELYSLAGPRHLAGGEGLNNCLYACCATGMFDYVMLNVHTVAIIFLRT